MDEENENVLAEPMFQSWDGKPIYAKKAELDKNGNDIVATYATKAEVESAMGDIETLLAAL